MTAWAQWYESFAPLINAYVNFVYFLLRGDKPLLEYGGVHTGKGERRTHRRPFCCTPLSPVVMCSLPIMVKWEPGAIATEEYGRGTMVLTLCLSCGTLQGLKWTGVYDVKGLKRSNKHTGSEKQRYIR